MNREINNPVYDFLFDNLSPLHIYYRWKIFSILHSDAQKSWRMKPFRMFKGGSIWIPPTNLDFTQGMPDVLLNPQNLLENNQLSERQATNFIKILRSLTTDRKSIAEALVFCIDHKSAISECIDLIIDSLQDIKTGPIKKIARLYLLSDVLSNCKSRSIKLDLQTFELNIMKAFDSLYDCYKCLKYESDQNHFKYRVLSVIRQWDISQILSVKVMEKIEATFLEQKVIEDEDQSSIDEPLDGAKLLQRTLNSDIGPEIVTKTGDIKKEVVTSYFVPSKWDEVDPEELENQSVSAMEIQIMEKTKKKKHRDKARKHKH